MPIDKPDSGSIITPDTIKDMHGQVRSAVNSVPVTSLGRGTFNMFQLPSLISRTAASTFDTSDYGDLAYGFTDVTTDCEVKYVTDQANPTFTDTEPNVWDELEASDGSNPYRISELEDSGGWRLKEDDVVFVFLSCRIGSIRDGIDTFVGHGGVQAWLGLYKTIITGWGPDIPPLEDPVVDAVDIGCIRLGNSALSYNDNLEETITIASAFNGTTFGYSGDWALTKLSAHGVLIKGDWRTDSTGDYDAGGSIFTVKSGSMGAFVLRTSGIQT
tara:strand:- start:1407 stop:2222 length:816 start_codon:yes stop_codon:yes gene_type:complete